MTSRPASRASQAREALSGLDVLNLVTDALMDGCDLSADEEDDCQSCRALEALRGCFILTAEESTALLSGGAGEATPACT